MLRPSPARLPQFAHVSHDIVHRFIRYWLDRRQGRLMPRKSDIDPVDVYWALPYASVIEIQDEGRKAYVRLSGEKVREAWGRKIVDRTIQELLPRETFVKYAANLKRMYDEKLILHSIGSIDINPNTVIPCERMFLPLSDRDDLVTHCFGLSLYDFHKGHRAPRPIPDNVEITTTPVATLPPDL
jgi:hypothetical protein